MSVITAKGTAAKESLNKKNQSIDWKKVYVRLKDGDSVRVRLLSSEDYVEYKAHGSYEHGIWTQPCISPMGCECALCKAADADLENFSGLYAKKRYLFAMYDIDEKMIRVFDATKGQAQSIINDIEQYADDLSDVAFTFKRTGNKTDTTYKLSPILKLKPQDREKFDAAEEMEVELSYFETILQPRTFEQQIEELTKAGFPVKDYFDVIPSTQVDNDVKPIDSNSEDIPF